MVGCAASAASSGVELLVSAASVVEADWISLGAVLLAIASPIPANTDIGSEKSASQCSPVTQLNSSIPTYKQTMQIAQKCILLYQCFNVVPLYHIP